MQIIRLLLLSIFISSSFSFKTKPLEYIGRGVDLKTGIFNLAKIFNLTYGDGQLWISPYTKTEYLIPDQLVVADILLSRELVLQNAYQLYSNFLNQFKSWFKFNIDATNGALTLGHKYDDQLAYAYNYMQPQNNTLLHGNHYWFYLLCTIYPPKLLNLDNMFIREVSLLPDIIITDKDHLAYKYFVQSFGTHYMYRSFMGARLDYNTIVSNNLIQKYGYDWICTQYELYFYYNLFDMNSGGFNNKTDIIVDLAFLRDVKLDVTFYGGDPMYTNINNLAKWLKNIDTNVYPINATLVEISELIDNPTKQTTMKEFVDNYINN